MLPGTTELILVIAIAICIFGLGRLGDISRAIGERRARKAKGLADDDVVDITPEVSDADRGDSKRAESSSSNEGAAKKAPAAHAVEE